MPLYRYFDELNSRFEFERFASWTFPFGTDPGPCFRMIGHFETTDSEIDRNYNLTNLWDIW